MVEYTGLGEIRERGKTERLRREQIAIDVALEPLYVEAVKKAIVTQFGGAGKETISIETAVTSSQLDCKFMRSRRHTSIAFEFVQARDHSEELIRIEAVKVIMKEAQRGDFAAVSKWL